MSTYNMYCTGSPTSPGYVKYISVLMCSGPDERFIVAVPEDDVVYRKKRLDTGTYVRVKEHDERNTTRKGVVVHMCPRINDSKERPQTTQDACPFTIDNPPVKGSVDLTHRSLIRYRSRSPIQWFPMYPEQTQRPISPPRPSTATPPRHLTP